MVDLRTSLSACNKRLDDFDARLSTLENLGKKTENGSNIDFLERTVTQLQTDLNDRDQELLSSDLEISNVPEVRGESVMHAVSVLANKLGVKLDERDIVFAERVGARQERDGEGQERGRGRRIVVRLARRSTRDELLQSARVRRGTTSADLAPSQPPRQLYINERLTKTNKQLFYRAREAGRRLQWRFVWTRRGRIFARQAEGKPACCIRTEADYVRVFGTDVVGQTS